MRPSTLPLVITLALAASAHPDELVYKERLLGELVKKVPAILKTFDAQTGRFGSGIWICGDQHPMYPLAVAYSTPGDKNPYYHDPKLLSVIVKSGDPLIEKMDGEGRWIFEKKDGSTWGMIWMPWTYSRWIRTFGLIRDQMPPEARKAWTGALGLGFTGISKNCLGHVHNIPAHHAMGLYAAGTILDRPDWRRQAADFMVRVIGSQSEGGYWPEGGGPVVAYDFVYVDAVGTYYAMSGDQRVLPALEKAAAFHRHFTYPGGQNVETIDQRNPFAGSIASGNAGFTFSRAGRAYLQNQWSRLGIDRLDADLIASLLLYGKEGPIDAPPAGETGQTFVLSEGGVDRAATLRRGPWFVCLSAYTTPIVNSRWIQDRQNLVSIYHDKTGLIVGGGNTKLQPGWSNFTIGDPALLAHAPGDENPDFIPKGELHHVPSAARLVLEPEAGLDLAYGPETCRVRLAVKDEATLEYRLETTTQSNLPAAGHLTLLPHLGETLETAGGTKTILGSEPIELAPEQVGGSVTHAGWRLRLPASTSLRWPVLPHNPYRKDGRAAPAEGRIVIRIPFDQDHRAHRVAIEILGR